jgi:hypothetical protein
LELVPGTDGDLDDFSSLSISGGGSGDEADESG